MAAPAIAPRWATPAFLAIFLLSATSGIVDAASFVRYHVFVANQTGNLVIVALSFADKALETARIPSMVGICTFVIGVFAAVGVKGLLTRRGMSDLAYREMLLIIEVIVIAVTAIALIRVPEAELACIGLLSVSQAVQGVAFTRIAGVNVQTVVINASVVQSAEAVAQRNYRLAVVFAATPIGYLLGAGLGAALLRLPVGTALAAACLTALTATLVVRWIRLRGADVG